LPRLGGSLDAPRLAPFALVAGVCGPTRQAVAEAELANSLGYHAGLLSLAAMRGSEPAAIIAHCRAIADVMPLVGFYLQPAVGGIPLGYAFWREFAEIPNVVAVKVAPFDRYRTIDVVRAVGDAGRTDIALYTGNDDNIVVDLLTKYPGGVRMVGGLLGHWAFWTRKAVELHRKLSPRALRVSPRAKRGGQSSGMKGLLTLAAQTTDANGAIFDAANSFRGCIPGIHEVLRRQGLLRGRWCLDPKEELSPRQGREIDRVCRAYPHLNDDRFVRERLDRWLR
jgi:dihydrodipicolinate synthase/N-acetylneuraminate lyase